LSILENSSNTTFFILRNKSTCFNEQKISFEVSTQSIPEPSSAAAVFGISLVSLRFMPRRKQQRKS
jgi:hypothetical protein